MRTPLTAILVAVLAMSTAADSRAACVTDIFNTSSGDLEIFFNQGAAPGPLEPSETRRSIYYAPFMAIDCARLPCPGSLVGIQDPWGFFVGEDGVWLLDSNDWFNLGKSHAQHFDPTQPYVKILNSAYVTFFGLRDDPDRSWHGTEDYVKLSIAGDSGYHSSFFRHLSDNRNLLGFFSRNFIGDDEVAVTCNAFDNQNGGAKNNVASRAGNFMHESWHAWENSNFHAGGVAHVKNPSAPNPLVRDGVTTPCTVGQCDPYYPHTLETFRPFGTLNQAAFSQASGTAWLPSAYTANVANSNKFHSPRQIQFEFLCDLADAATVASWVPLDVMMAAQADAQARFAREFVNSPPMQCGNNHPMITVGP